MVFNQLMKIYVAYTLHVVANGLGKTLYVRFKEMELFHDLFCISWKICSLLVKSESACIVFLRSLNL